ncbi:tip elongation aberrant protein 1 [Cyclospora cayetanensis]|nr:tip elongation aberrant protein 1 [Cyclospora cayetanensis]
MEPPVDCLISVPKFGPPPRTDPSAGGGGGLGRGRRLVVSKLNTGGDPPSARGGHTATLVGDKIYLFGGHELRGADKGFAYHNAVFVLDLKGRRWVPFKKQKGTPAAPRYGHTASLFRSRIIIFGGKGGPNLYFQDLNALDVDNATWYKGLSRRGDPGARFWHSSNISGDHMYVFGGACGSTLLGDLHALNLTTMEWQELKPRGRAPRPRVAHASALANGYLLIHGGMARTVLEDTQAEASALNAADLATWYLGDLHALSLSALTWHRLRVQGDLPTPRMGHTLAPLGNSLLLWGGWPHRNSTRASMYNPDSKQQELMMASAPTDSDPTAALLLQSEEPQEIPLQDAAALCSYTGEWSPIFVRGKTPACRYGHSQSETPSGVVVLGGWTSPVPLMEALLIQEEEEETAS